MDQGWVDYRDHHLGPELAELEGLDFAHADVKPHVLGPDGRTAYVTSEYTIKGRMKERDIDGGAFRRRCAIEQLRHAMQGLRAEYHVHERRARDDGRALLAGNTTADTDHDVGSRLLERAPTAKFAEYLFLRLLADRAGVEQQQIRRQRVVGGNEAMRIRQQIRDSVRIVGVHLTAEGFDIELSGHGHGRGRTRAANLPVTPTQYQRVTT